MIGCERLRSHVGGWCQRPRDRGAYGVSDCWTRLEGFPKRLSNVLRERTHVQPVTHRESDIQPRLSLVYSFQAGGLAGTSVDLLFYPIDSIKTRLQADRGFYKAGGFRGIYNGVASVIVGSAPGGTLFPSLSDCASCPNVTHLDPSCCLLLYLRHTQAGPADPSPPRTG